MNLFENICPVRREKEPISEENIESEESKLELEKSNEEIFLKEINFIYEKISKFININWNILKKKYNIIISSLIKIVKENKD